MNVALLPAPAARPTLDLVFRQIDRLMGGTGAPAFLPSPVEHEPPTDAFAWWRWLSDADNQERFTDRLARSPLGSSLPTVRVERTMVEDPARWSFQVQAGEARLDLVVRDWFVRGPTSNDGRMLLLDEACHLFNAPTRRGKSHLLMDLLTKQVRTGGPRTVVMATQTLSDFTNTFYHFTEGDLVPASLDLPLESLLLACDRTDLLDLVVAESGGWTHARRRVTLTGLRFLQLPPDWTLPVQRWVEQTELRLVLDEGLPALARKRL